MDNPETRKKMLTSSISAHRLHGRRCMGNQRGVFGTDGKLRTDRRNSVQIQAQKNLNSERVLKIVKRNTARAAAMNPISDLSAASIRRERGRIGARNALRIVYGSDAAKRHAITLRMRAHTTNQLRLRVAANKASSLQKTIASTKSV